MTEACYVWAKIKKKIRKIPFIQNAWEDSKYTNFEEEVRNSIISDDHTFVMIAILLDVLTRTSAGKMSSRRITENQE